jgi:hypothetical protein
MKILNIKDLKVVWSVIFLTIFTNCSDQAKSQRGYDPEPQQSRKIQIALLLDTSNSMDGLIDQAKSQLWSIVNELAKAKCGGEKPELQIALYEYGNDNLPSSEGYIRLVTPLTSDLDQISEDLFELRTNGGNEFCGEVIQASLKQLHWSKSETDLQLIYIAGNEPFTQGRTNYRTACQDAKEKGVIVNTIFCGNFNEGINTSWKHGADLTGGCYASIEQNRKTVYIESPYDQRIVELNILLNNTYVPYGVSGYEKKALQERQDANAQQYGSANKVKRAVSKSSHVYRNSSWDLVDASEEENFRMEEIKESELPEEMQKMDKEERIKYVEQKAADRQKIRDEIQELNKKRTEYVAQQSDQNDDDGMLDKAILTSLREQASDRDFVIE